MWPDRGWQPPCTTSGGFVPSTGCWTLGPSVWPATGPAGPAPSSSTEGRGANAALEDWEHPPRSWQDLYASTETLLMFLARLKPNFGPIGFLFKDIHHTGVTTAILGPTHLCSTGECHKYAHFTGRGIESNSNSHKVWGKRGILIHVKVVDIIPAPNFTSSLSHPRRYQQILPS